MFFALFFCAALLPVHLFADEPLTLTASAGTTSPATAGYFTLDWSRPDETSAPAVDYILERDSAVEFSNPRVLYRGPDTASTRSGLADGTYYYRVRRGTEPAAVYSPIVAVQVEHHALSRAFGFLGVGLFVFLCSLIVILLGLREENKLENANSSGAASRGART